jgi:hypothetical protein
MLRDAAYHLGACGIHQPGQLLEVLGNVPRVGRSLAWGGDQYHPLDGVANWYQRSNRGPFLSCGTGSITGTGQQGAALVSE